MTRFALVIALAIGCGSATPPSGGGGGGGASPSEPATSCSASEDCELVDACCGCNAGGRKIAIRKDAVASFAGSREQRCAGQMCTQMMSTHASCDAEATCGNNGRCRVAPHLQHQ